MVDHLLLTTGRGVWVGTMSSPWGELEADILLGDSVVTSSGWVSKAAMYPSESTQ